MGYGSSEAFELLVRRLCFFAALTREPTRERRRGLRAGGVSPTTAPSSALASQVRTPFRVGEMKTVAALPTAIYQNVREDAM